MLQRTRCCQLTVNGKMRSDESARQGSREPGDHANKFPVGCQHRFKEASRRVLRLETIGCIGQNTRHQTRIYVQATTIRLILIIDQAIQDYLVQGSFRIPDASIRPDSL